MLVGILLSRQLVSRLSLRKTEAGRRRKTHQKSTLIRTLAYNPTSPAIRRKTKPFPSFILSPTTWPGLLGAQDKRSKSPFFFQQEKQASFRRKLVLLPELWRKFSFRSHPLGSTSAKGCPIYCLTEHNRTEDLLKSKSMTFCYCGAGVGIGEGAVLYSNSD